MAEDNVDIETLSDEDFMKLDQPPLENVADSAEAKDEIDPDADAPTGDPSDADDKAITDEAEVKAGDEIGAGEGDDKEEKGKEDPIEALSDEEVIAGKVEKGVNDDKETLTLDPTKEEKAAAEAAKLAEKEPDNLTDEEKKAEKETADAAKLVEDQAAATTFFDKVSAPFKADGKDVQIRTPEEAIRLMQMGVNYSRRMKEMKPLREMDAMLTQHGLNDPVKLNELVDLSKGSKEAIQKYLKKHNIDPLDLDTSKGDEHTTPNYQADPKDVAFQDAIDATLQTEGGRDLLSDVNKDWDEQSKEALRDNPEYFTKLLDHKDTGVYEQINKELLHQRTMGYLANVPFLQAYEQVGNAMLKAGVFDEEEEVTQKTGLAPIASGVRKAAPKPKTEQPNPNLSSPTTRKAPRTEEVPTEPDYLTMSDDDFMKMAQPT